MKLHEFNQLLPIPEHYRDIEITGVTNDSRNVKPGDLFFAVPGLKTDGFLFLEDAFRRGARMAVMESGNTPAVDYPVLKVENIRRVEGLAAALFFGAPSQKLRMIGITGTNGKTTVAHLIRHLLDSVGIPAALIGTVWIDYGAGKQKSQRTTPDSLELQRLLREMVDFGTKTVIMEASSHALALQRVVGVEFDGAVFTNITQDHFDFHHDFSSYLKAKRLLFEGLTLEGKSPKYAVINRNDPEAAVMADVCRVPVFDYGTKLGVRTKLKKIARRGRKSVLTIDLCGEPCQITTSLPGEFNFFNILGASTVAYLEGMTIPEIEAGLAGFPGVPGRYQEINCGQPFRLMVDFAHNPDALKNILEMAGEQTSGQRILVFGCEGEKDRLKRPLMGKVAVQLAEIPILTSDNVYHEDLEQIFEDVFKGLMPEERAKLRVEPDRREAIRTAITMAAPGDFVIIAGKGNEEYIVQGDERIPFDDVEVVKEVLKRLGEERIKLSPR